MRTMNRWEQPFRGATTLQEQINRVFGDMVGRTAEESNLTPWARRSNSARGNSQSSLRYA